MSQIKIIPSILAYDVNEFKEKLQRVEEIVDRVQVDIVGRAFDEGTTVGVEVLEQISSSVAVDVQLMVKEPMMFINRCDLAGVNRIYGHVEYMKQKEELIEYVLTLGMQVGLGIDLQTPASEIEGWLDSLDSVLVMSVAAGRSGREFNESVIAKIRKLREKNSGISICVDGGINDKNIKRCFDAGANEFAVGSYLWESKDIAASISKLLNLVL
jgi:ribulose-phosphate 3-epimerase